MTVRPRRPSIDEAVGESFSRIRTIERHNEGAWVTVGSGLPLPDGPDLDGNADAPPFLSGFGPHGGGFQTLQFKWLALGGVHFRGSAAGGGIGLPIFRLPNTPFYRDPSQTGTIKITAADDDDLLLVLYLQDDGFVICGA